MTYRIFYAKTALVFVIILPGAARAQQETLIDADRPGIADSATVVGRGTVQIEGGAAGDRAGTGAGKTTTRTLPLLLRWGLSEHVELRVESETVSRQRSSSPGSGPTESGFSPVALGFKWQAVDGGTQARVQDFGFIGSLTVPSGTKAFRQSHASGSMLAAGDVALTGKWVVNPNAGIGLYHGADGQSHLVPAFAATFEYDVTERVHPAFEFARMAPGEGEDKRETIIDVQLAWIVKPSVQFDVEAGRGLENGSRRYATAGISVRFR